MNTPNKENSEVKNYSCPLKQLNSGTLKACNNNQTFRSLPTAGGGAFSFYQFQIKIDIDLGLCPLPKITIQRKKEAQ
jgi:hypothetical protein